MEKTTDEGFPLYFLWSECQARVKFSDDEVNNNKINKTLSSSEQGYGFCFSH